MALSLSLLVSYTRAKGDALGVNLAGIGVGERSERLVVLIVTSLLGIVGLGVLIIVLLALITFVQRTVTVSRALGRRRQESPKVPRRHLDGEGPSSDAQNLLCLSDLALTFTIP